MVSRAVSTISNSTSPSRTKASAECSACVLPRSARNCSDRLGAVGRLAEALRAQRQGLVAAQHQMTRLRRCHRVGFGARQQAPAAAAASRTPAFASIARSSICAGRIPKRRPAAARILPRMSLFEASTSGCGAIQSGMNILQLHEYLTRDWPASTFAQQFHHRGGGLFDRAPRHVDDRPVVLGAQVAANKRLPPPPRPCRYIDRHRDAHSIRADGFRGSARCARDWRKVRPPEAWLAFRLRALTVHPAPAAHCRSSRRDWRDRSRSAFSRCATRRSTRRRRLPGLRHAGRRHASW